MLWGTIDLDKWRKHRVCPHRYVKCLMNEYSRDIRGSRNISWKQSHYSSQRFEYALPLSTLHCKNHQKVPCQTQYDSFEASITFLGLVTTRFLPVSVTKKCSERTMICERWESHCKSDGNRFPGMLPKLYKCWKSVPLPKGTTLKEMLCKYI
jgi:hypothetical protein